MLPVFREELVLITPKSFGPIRTPRDIAHRTVIAFPAGCSYRRRLETWLGGAQVLADRVMEFQSYHAIVACVAAGSGIAVVPRAILPLTNAGDNLNLTTLPAKIAKSRTQLVWRNGHHSSTLEAMKGVLAAKAKQPRQEKR